MFTDFGWLGWKSRLLIRTLATSRISRVTQKRGLRNWDPSEGGAFLGGAFLSGTPLRPKGGRGAGPGAVPGGLAAIGSHSARRGARPVSAPAVEDDDRDLAGGPALVVGKARHHLRLGCEEALVLLAGRDARRGDELLAQDLHRDLRIGDQVVVPARILGRAALGGDDHVVVAGSREGEGVLATLAGLGAGGGQDQDRSALEGARGRLALIRAEAGDQGLVEGFITIAGFGAHAGWKPLARSTTFPTGWESATSPVVAARSGRCSACRRTRRSTKPRKPRRRTRSRRTVHGRSASRFAGMVAVQPATVRGSGCRQRGGGAARPGSWCSPG